MTQIKVGDIVLARGEVIDIVQPDGMEDGGVWVDFGDEGTWVDFDDVQVIEESQTSQTPKTPVTGVRAWIAKTLVALALRVVFGRNEGRELSIKFNEEAD